MEVEMVIGDKAYSEQKNIEAAQDGGYELISRLNGIITQGNRTKEDEFEFNKDAGMYQCKVLFGKLSAPTFFTLNAPVFQMVWINIQNFCICLRSLFKVSIV